MNHEKMLFVEKKALERPKKLSDRLKMAASEAEYEMIIEVLKKVNFNRSKAANMLNIDRKTLYNKMRKMNL
jgi:two-component system response regulator HydG